MKSAWRLIVHYVRHNFMAALAYRGAFAMQVLGMMLNNVMLLFFWTLLFQRFPLLNGWDLTGVVTIYAIAASGFGLSVVVFGNASWVAALIAGGDLDYYLVLPADPLLHLLVSRMTLPGWGDIFFGLLLYVIAIPTGWQRLPLFILLTVLVAFFFASVGVLTGSLAFWLGQAQELAMQLRNATLSFALYPIDFFPAGVRGVLYTLIPSAFVGSVPARLLLDFDVRWLALLSLVTVGICLLARWVFYRGLRRYASGNLVTTRG